MLYRGQADLLPGRVACPCQRCAVLRCAARRAERGEGPRGERASRSFLGAMIERFGGGGGEGGADTQGHWP